MARRAARGASLGIVMNFPWQLVATIVAVPTAVALFGCWWADISHRYGLDRPPTTRAYTRQQEALRRASRPRSLP